MKAEQPFAFRYKIPGMITVFLRGKGKVYEGNHIKRWTKKKKKKRPFKNRRFKTRRLKRRTAQKSRRTGTAAENTGIRKKPERRKSGKTRKI